MASDKDFRMVMWVIVGIVIFWVIAIPALAFSKPLGGK